jgi:hypothetical protein
MVLREGKQKPCEDVMEEADDDRLEREDLGTWDGQYHLSVFAAPLQAGETLDSAVSRLFGAHRRVKFYRAAMLEALGGAGFDLAASPPEPYHYDVRLGTKLTDEIVEAFEQCFGEARRNPAWQRRS